jgi:hypothetical protein
MKSELHFSTTKCRAWHLLLLIIMAGLSLHSYSQTPAPTSPPTPPPEWLQDLLSQLTPEELSINKLRMRAFKPDLEVVRDYLQLFDAPVPLRDNIVVEKGKTLLIRSEQTQCDHFEAQDGSRIIISPKITDWTLKAETATFGKGVIIDGRGINVLKAAKNGIPGTVGRNGPNGVKGRKAIDGGDGEDGKSGTDGVSVTFSIKGKLSVEELRISLQGGSGRNGGTGANGGRGADAAIGKGGSDGGNGGDAGNGGDGGNGGDLTITFGEGSKEGISHEVHAGKHGLKGRPGKGGAGGKGRPRNPPPLLPTVDDGQFTDQPSGDDGADGVDATDGQEGTNGRVDISKL